MGHSSRPRAADEPMVHPISTPMYLLAWTILHGEADWVTAQALATLILDTDKEQSST